MNQRLEKALVLSILFLLFVALNMLLAGCGGGIDTIDEREVLVPPASCCYPKPCECPKEGG